MNKNIGCALLATCLAVPTLAWAYNETRTYAGNSDFDRMSFTLDVRSNVEVGYWWEDFSLVKNKYPTKEVDASSLAWTLTGGATKSGTLVDLSDVFSGSGILDLGELSAGSYKLTFTGTWGSTTLSGANRDINGWSRQDGHVDLIDGSRRAVAAVPEPGTCAMLLAGLGLMGFVARRRSKD